MNSGDERILDSFRYIRPSKGNLYSRLIDLCASRIDLSHTIDDLFSTDGEPAKDPFFAVRLRGDRPNGPAAAFRYEPDGIVLEKMPLARLVEYSCDFLSRYNEKVQDRNRNVTAYSYVEYDRILFPLVLSAIIAGYSTSSMTGVSISYHLGVFSLSFRNRLGPSMSSSEFVAAMVKDPMFRLLCSEIGAVDKDGFARAFSDEKVSFGHEHGGDFATIQYAKPYDSKEAALKDRVQFFIQWTGKASRKEISEYFQKSDRLINYVLKDLVAEGKIRRIGELHDPTAKYTVE